MAQNNEYLNRLHDLQCHFRWNPETDVKSWSIESVIAKAEADLRHSPFLRLPTLALLSYLSTRDSDRTNLQEASAYIDQAKDLQNDPSFVTRVTCDFVLRANELHIKYIRGERGEEMLSQLERVWSDRNSNPLMEAAVWGAKGHAMSKFGVTKYEEGVDDYQKAIDLEPQNAHWQYGKALLLGRLRRARRDREPATDEELDLFKRAYELDTCKTALYASSYGFSLAESIAHTKIKYKDRRECIQAVEQAQQFANGNQSIYRDCAKVYRLFHYKDDHKQFHYKDDQRECLLKGIRSCSPNDHLLHALGNYYWHQMRDLSRAEKCFIESIDVAKEYFGRETCWTELDLLKIKIELNSTEDIVDQLHKLEIKYPWDSKFLTALRGVFTAWNHTGGGHRPQPGDRTDA